LQAFSRLELATGILCGFPHFSFASDRQRSNPIKFVEGPKLARKMRSEQTVGPVTFNTRYILPVCLSFTTLTTI
jgi:hypothetical protein